MFLYERAADNLRFIRAAMESASAFTGLSGLGFVLAGCSALGAVWLAERQGENTAWLLVWMGEMILAGGLILALTLRKAARQGLSLWSHAGRKLLLAFLPPMAAGGLLTAVLLREGNLALLPGLWLSLYGAGVTTGGLFSIPLIPLMGLAFMALGGLALFLPGWGAFWSALGFGGLHIIFGTIIWRKHGG